MRESEHIGQQLSTVRDYLRWAVSRMTTAPVYFGHGTDNALDEALNLVLPLAGIPPGCERDLLDATLLQSERVALITAIDRRVRDRVPVPYLTGEAWFAGMPYYVDQRVLIPRSPIAELIGQSFAPWLQHCPEHILDLCTGSGCIGIACAQCFDDAQVDLADLSADALAVAAHNIDRYQLQGRVSAIQSDVFAGLSGRQYDLIVCNPPYVDRDDLAAMPAEYHHEPGLALASGDDGLDITRLILRDAARHLTAQGLLVVEVGNSWVALEQAFPTVSFTWIEFEHGGHGVFIFTRQELVEHQREFL